jgi:hypothetical protein
VFANKQDLPGALSMDEIREVGTATKIVPTKISEMWTSYGATRFALNFTKLQGNKPHSSQKMTGFWVNLIFL